MDLTAVSKYLIYSGVFMLTTGSILYFLSKLDIGLGRLPGDIIIQRENSSFYFPLATSIIISIVLTLILNIFVKRR